MKYPNSDIFQGQFKNDKMNGHGVYKYADGAIYEGEFKYGKKNGHGVYTWTDGSKYKGQFFNDKIKNQMRVRKFKD